MIVYRELSSLSKDLGFGAKALYAASNHINSHYRSCSIKKKDGTMRTLNMPDSFLKSIQRAVVSQLLVYEPISECASAYRIGGSTKVNAMPHVGQAQILKLDIRKFFDSIIYPMVKEKAFPSERYSESNRILLTHLCIYKDSLPQGAPSSPVISNIIMKDFDDEVGSWCSKKGITYTRYCDDMTFSGSFDPHEVKSYIRTELAKMGFFLNSSKTVLRNQGQRMSVTGITVNRKMSVCADYRRKIRQEIYYCKKFGVQSHLEHNHISISAEEYLKKLLGRVNYVLSVDLYDREMTEYRKWLQDQLNKGFQH